jgi:hypothetical protein
MEVAVADQAAAAPLIPRPPSVRAQVRCDHRPVSNASLEQAAQQSHRSWRLVLGPGVIEHQHFRVTYSNARQPPTGDRSLRFQVSSLKSSPYFAPRLPPRPSTPPRLPPRPSTFPSPSGLRSQVSGLRPPHPHESCHPLRRKRHPPP